MGAKRDARRFRGLSAGGRARLSHTWQLRLDLRVLGDKAVEHSESGDFPPQQVR